MPDLIIASKAYTTDTGAPGAYALSGGPVDARKIYDVMNNDQETYFHISGSQGGMVFLGRFNNPGQVITVLEIYCSTADGSEIVWGEGQKLVACVAHPDHFLNMDNMVAGSNYKLFSAAEQNKLAGLPRPFAHLTDQEPVKILLIGDSNAGGVFVSDASAYSSDANISVYDTGAPGSTFDTADLAYRNVDPNSAVAPNFNDVHGAPQNRPFTGLFRGSSGNTGYGAAARCRLHRGGQVYLLPCWRAGGTMDTWQPTTGVGMLELDAIMPAAIAAHPGPSKFFDVVLMHTGGNDINAGTTPAAFVAKHQTMYDYMVAQGWIDPVKTLWYQFDVPETFPAYKTGGWPGLDLLERSTESNVKIVPVVGMETNPGDLVHFLVPALKRMEERAIDDAFGGPAVKYVRQPFLTDMSSVPDSATAVAHRRKTHVAYTTPGAVLDAVYNLDSLKYFLDKDGIPSFAGLGATGANKRLVAGPFGTLIPVGQARTFYTGAGQTTDTTGVNVGGFTPAINTRYCVELLVTANRQGTVGTYCARFLISCTRGATGDPVVAPAGAAVPDAITTSGTGNTLSVNLISFYNSLIVLGIGNVGETWDWKTELVVRSLI